MNVRKDLVQGLRDGFPIGLGYAPVAFTFGFIAVSGGLPLWAAALISLTNLTSAGQFAGTNLILQGAGYIEVAMTTFVINIRYMLMSLSLGQRLEKGTGILSRMGFGFGITDETFVMASLKPGILRAPYLFGLILFPILGWNLGTILGGSISAVLPEALQNAMVVMAVAANCMLKYIPVFSFISPGFRIILSTVAGAGLGAALFPRDEAEYVKKEGETE